MDSLCVDIQGYVSALLENLPGMSCSKTYWLLSGGWSQCRYGSFWTVSLLIVACSQEFFGDLRFWA